MIVGPVLGIWHDDLIPLATLGVLTVFGAAARATSHYLIDAGRAASTTVCSL